MAVYHLANFGRVCLGTLSIAGDRRLSDLSSTGLGPNGDEVKAKVRSVLSPSVPLHLSRIELKARECLVNPDVVVAIHSLHDRGRHSVWVRDDHLSTPLQNVISFPFTAREPAR